MPLSEFVIYFMEFYGPDGLYKNCHGKKEITKADVYEGIAKVVFENPQHEFCGDTWDRELVLKAISGINLNNTENSLSESDKASIRRHNEDQT